MSVRLSTGARNGMTNGRGLASMFNRGYIEVYAGSQPVSADLASTAFTKLGIVTAASAALTKETRATGSIVLAGASGTVNSVSVGGLNIIPDVLGTGVPFNTSLTQTALDLADAINRNGIMEASSSSATVTLKGRPGTGVTTAAVTNSLTTLTSTLTNMGSGVAGVAPLNGLIFGAEGKLLTVDTPGTIAKLSTQIWSFVGLAAGTAGWARLYSSDTADTGAAITTAPWYPRMDMSCGVGSGDLQLSTISIALSGPVTIDRFEWTQPAS